MFNTKKEFEDQARPLAEGIIGYAMSTGRKFGITDVDVRISASEKQDNTIEGGHVTKSVFGNNCSIHVSLYAGDRLLSFSRNTLDADALREAILKNMQIIHLVPENKEVRLLEQEKVYTGALPNLNMRDLLPLDKDAMVSYAIAAEKAALAVPGIKIADSTNFSKNTQYSFVLATNGLDRCGEGGYYQTYVSAIAANDKGMETSYGFSASRHFSDMARPEDVGRHAGETAVQKLGAHLPKTGEMSIVLDNRAAENFFNAVYASISGWSIFNNRSFMKGKIGQQVMSSEITLVDDPLIEKGLYSSAIDSAGLKMEKITFIENGILKNYELTLMSARQLGMEPIGREDGTTNSSILPGSKTPEELMSDIHDGIYIHGFNGGTVDVNHGTYSREAYGLLIKDGKITNTPVSGFVVSGNLKDMFMNVAIANDTPKHPSNKHALAAPTTRINKVMIAGK